MRLRRPPATTHELLADLRATRLLSAAQAARLAQAWGPGPAAPRVRELVAAGLLTSFQAEQVLAGHARRLRLGPYRLLDRLGAGGMARVYKAEHVLMKRTVALKVLARDRVRAPRPGADDTPVPRSLRAAFRAEVRAAARLRHPNVVTTYDAGTARARLYLVMEYVDGTDLERLVAAGGALPVALACEVVRQAALGLQCLHGHGLVHRDIKPANLLLTWAESAPVVKLLDLGLAARAARGRRRRADRLCGTLDYMAPERGMGDGTADARSDLYSLGCTFYHLLTGRVPFPGDSWTTKLLSHRLEVPTPVRALRPEVPDAVAGVVERLMARDPDDRFADAGQLLDALDGPHAAEAPPAPPVSPSARLRRPRPWLWQGAAAVLLGVAAALGLRATLVTPRSALPPSPPGAPPPAAARASITVAGAPGAFAGLAEAVAAAPDGGTVTLTGPGPFVTGPLHLAGKRLTLRAAPGPRPRLLRAAAADDQWAALLGGDRSLTLHGLELGREAPGGADTPAATAPLVCVAGGALRLRDCRLRDAGPAPLLSLRGGGRLEVDGCTLEGGLAAVAAEVGPGCRVEVRASTVRVDRSRGVALALWASEAGADGPAEVVLGRSTWEVGRVVDGRGLRGPLGVCAADNAFTFTNGLLGTDGDGPTTWQDRNNSYRATGAWLWRGGAPGPAHDGDGWRRHWAASSGRPVG